VKYAGEEVFVLPALLYVNFWGHIRPQT